jgi:lactate dehydrogenase-like 2-hydroxyacid dehydrogenase
MERPELLLTGPLYPELTARLDAEFATVKPYLAADPRAVLAEATPRIRAIATRGMVGADAALIARLPKLEIIACFAVGTDKIDLAAARARGIRVTNTPDVLTEDTADFGIAMIFALARRIVEGDRFIRAGQWLKGGLPSSTRVHGKRLGIVGLGRIGEGIARRAGAFAMEIAYTGPRAKPEKPWRFVPDVAELAHGSDFLVLCCPGGPATRHLVDAGVLEALGPKGMLVNIARGSVVDEAALIAALAEKKIAGAALDVFSDEPNVPPTLLALDNVVLAPHIASTTEETRAAMGELVYANLAAHFAGRPLLSPVA